MLSSAFLDYYYTLAVIRCTSIFVKTELGWYAVKNQPTETHVTKSKIGLQTPRHLFGPY